MATHIHPTAIVDDNAEIGANVSIGPYCTVGPNVQLGDGVQLQSHVVVTGHTRIGDDTRVFPFTSVGHQPQDLKFEGEKSHLIIGKNCTIRENCTLNPGTNGGGLYTRVGDSCLLMASTHIAHDCQLGNNVVVGSFTGLAGHVCLGDFVILGLGCVVHQYVRVGAHAFVGAQSMVDSDVIPYGMAVGNRAELAGLNLVGLKRRKFPRKQIHALRAAYRMIFSHDGTLRERVKDAGTMFSDDELVQNVVAFLTSETDRAFCSPRNGRGQA